MSMGTRSSSTDNLKVGQPSDTKYGQNWLLHCRQVVAETRLGEVGVVCSTEETLAFMAQVFFFFSLRLRQRQADSKVISGT